jgi:hypothetical protein
LSSALKKKLIIIGLSILFIGAMFLFDMVRSKTFHLEVVEMTPNPAVADGQTPVNVKVKLVDRIGKPVKGHSIFALAHTGGMFHSLREITDENGVTEFLYYPYKASGVTKLQDAVLSFTDETNSVFIEIGTTTKVSLELTKPEEQTVSDELLNGIFGN